MNRWSVSRAVLVGAVAGGALDLLFAISFAYSNGVLPIRLLQTIASGLLGSAAYDGGVVTAVVGFVSHFVISGMFAAAYVLASRQYVSLSRKAVLHGALFGILVFVIMRLVVLPLSAFPHPTNFKPLATTLDLLSHMFLFGVPIALAAKKTRIATQTVPGT